jgi:hypothetical protein
MAYLVLLAVASRTAFGSWVPETGERGLWLFSGVAALLLGDLLVSPYFTKPVDALSYSVAALIGLVAIDVWGNPTLGDFDQFLWTVAVAYMFICITSAVAAMALKDSTNVHVQRLSRTVYLVADNLGRPRWVFSVVFFFALLTYHRTEPREYLTISVAWWLTIGLQPLETLSRMAIRVIALWRESTGGKLIGIVAGHQSPGIVLIRQQSRDMTHFGTPLLVRADDGEPGIAISLDYVGYAEGTWLRALHVPRHVVCLADLGRAPRSGDTDECIALDPASAMDIGRHLDESQTWRDRQYILGVVAPDTSSSLLRVDVARTDVSLEEGRLVRVAIDHFDVLYQLIEGLTKEKLLEQKNTRGFVLAEAKQIGRWDEERQRFIRVSWIPRPNAPVFLVKVADGTPSAGAIGYFPGTCYPVSVNTHHLVTHNTAILGILGVGKSYLAIELVERLISDNIKVICLDLTNQYARELSNFYDAESEDNILRQLLAVGPPGATNYQTNKDDGGSIVQFQEKAREVVAAFLAADRTRAVLIVNPASFEVWKQVSFKFKTTEIPAMATLTPCEITRLLTEAVLKLLQDKGMTDAARCCLIYEEAHSLIPEWNAVASEGDKVATNGTAKAILQGRKFGLGAMVVTQRTANVTKTILNQCNTVFAMRVFDATGMEFLSNYIGDDYARILSTLEDRHAVVFGRASSCRDPVLIRLNDRNDFVKAFRKTSLADGSPGAL